MCVARTAVKAGAPVQDTLAFALQAHASVDTRLEATNFAYGVVGALAARALRIARRDHVASLAHEGRPADATLAAQTSRNLAGRTGGNTHTIPEVVAGVALVTAPAFQSPRADSAAIALRAMAYLPSPLLVASLAGEGVRHAASVVALAAHRDPLRWTLRHTGPWGNAMA